MRSYVLLLAAAPLVLAAPAPAPHPVAAPAPVPAPVPQGKETNPPAGILGSLVQGGSSVRSLSSAVPAEISDSGNFVDAAEAVGQAIANGTIFGTDVPAAVQKLFQAAKPTSTPTSYQDAMTKAAEAWEIKSISDISSATPKQNILRNIATLVLNGFTSSDLQAVIQGADPSRNSPTSFNPTVSVQKTFYNTIPGDAPFSVPEAQLRAAIYIPSDFTWGKKQPIIMSPGTATTGYINFRSNIGKLLATTSFADPVYLNVPGNLLGDAQVNAEYVSYALQYIYAQTSVKPAIVTWSQGSVDAQWTFKYWPSVPKIVTDHIAISPDYHGTLQAYVVCPGYATGDAIACSPSIYQQQYSSAFITKLRSNGGDSAYVPTTTVYSGVDEIVQPQQGTAASGFINDARGVGVSNTYLQGACALQPAGGLYLHEGVLYNPVAYALVVDALTHTGPGSFARVSAQCGNLVTPGLSLSDVIETEALIPLAALNIFSYMPKSFAEPAIKSYATT